MTLCSKNWWRVFGIVCLAVWVALPLPAQDEGGASPGKRGIKVVKSLFEHRRRDVREAAAREAAEREAAEEEKRPSFTDESTGARKQLEVLENLLQTRMLPGSKFNAGEAANSAIKVVCARAREAEASISVRWTEETEENEAIRLVDDIDLSGCNMAEALHRICASANCQYVLRDGQVVLESIAQAPQTVALAYHRDIVNECFVFSGTVFQHADGRRTRNWKHTDKGECLRIVQGKRKGKPLNRKIAGEYSNTKGILKLTGMPHTLYQCIQDLEPLYLQWLNSSQAKKRHAENPRGRRFKLEYKLNSAPAVPIEFPEAATVGDVIRYFSLVCRFARLKVNIKFAADREDLKRTLDRPLKIQNCTILEALFCACDSMQGGYTVRQLKVTLTPGLYEQRSYPVHTEFITLLQEEEERKQGRRATNKPSTSNWQNVVVSTATIRRVCRLLGVQLPENASASYNSTTYTLSVEADPRSIFKLNRLIYFTNASEAP